MRGNQKEKLGSLIFSEIALNSAGQIDSLYTSLLFIVTFSQDICSTTSTNHRTSIFDPMRVPPMSSGFFSHNKPGERWYSYFNKRGYTNLLVMALQ